MEDVLLMVASAMRKWAVFILELEFVCVEISHVATLVRGVTVKVEVRSCVLALGCPAFRRQVVRIKRASLVACVTPRVGISRVVNSCFHCGLRKKSVTRNSVMADSCTAEDEVQGAESEVEVVST